MFLCLQKYGFQPRMITSIKKMYESFKLEFKKGQKTVMIEYLIGVHQGDNLTSLLSIPIF